MSTDVVAEASLNLNTFTVDRRLHWEKVVEKFCKYWNKYSKPTGKPFNRVFVCLYLKVALPPL